MKIRPFEAGDQPAIDRLNARLTAGGARWPVYGAGPGDDATGPIRSRLYVARDGEEVRGAVWLREHEFVRDGETMRVGWAKYPVAESLVDSAFGGVPGALIFRLVREQPSLMALGMGGRDGAFAKLLRGMGWTGSDVPFYFSFARPSRVLRRLRPLRRTPTRKLLLDAAAFSGLGWLAWRVAEHLTRRTLPSSQAATAEPVEHFGDWADTIWSDVASHYGFLARRDAQMLNTVYPSHLPVTRLRFRRGGRVIGWAVVTHKDFLGTPDAAFGPLHVGLVADGLARVEDVQAVVSAATAFLRTRNVDLIFSNQSHPVWIAALEAEGFRQGPSQFAFFRSPVLVQAVGGSDATMHINRGDCDGPVFW